MSLWQITYYFMDQNNSTCDLSISLAGIEMKNPLMTASGTFGYGEEYADLLEKRYVGAVVTKGISLLPSIGNPPPRIFETPSGMLNAIGLQNVGFNVFRDEKLPFLRQFDAAVIVNFYGSTVEDYGILASKISKLDGVDGIEANISCPNIKQGGISFGTDPAMAYRVTREIRKATDMPLMVKLTPNVTDIAVVARAVEDAGADAVSLINTLTGMAVNVNSRRPELANVTGGLSGPAIRPIALRLVWETVKAVSLPVVGLGGIVTAEDALQFIIAGASAVQVGTGLFANPDCLCSIAEGITEYLEKNNCAGIDDIRGSLETG